jgi:SAM-dependent methyltransferase
MLELARRAVPGVEELRQLALPDDPLPPADAVVSVGHVLSYLSDEAAIFRALAAVATALRPGGRFAFDLCDLRYGEAHRDRPSDVRVTDDWAIITRFSLPQPTRLVRQITTFVRNQTEDASWRRDDERHENVLLDTTQAVALLRQHGLDATLGSSFGTEELPAGLATVIGSAARPPS